MLRRQRTKQGPGALVATRRAAVAIGAVLLGSSALLGIAPVISAPAQAVPAQKFYLSLGDSYSVGYQPGMGSTTGYTGVVATALGMQLENFGCGGATTSSLLNQMGCTPLASARTDAVAYPTTTQVAAAVAFMKTHPGQIGLITVSIGGNTITGCAGAATPARCVESAVATVTANLKVITSDLRAAAGPGVPIIGLTYPDVILGGWVYPPGHPDQTLATLSIVAFQDLFNPVLKSVYDSVGTFVDVTTATGAYTPLTETTTLPPYGNIPVAVAKVCELSYFCTSGTIHANTTGYTLIGNLIASTYTAITTDDGYWEVGSDGGVFSFGAAQYYGSMSGKPLNAPVVGMAAAPTRRGYWEAASDGGVFSFGSAQYYGSMAGKPLNAPVVGVAAAPTGQGYWEAASDGGVFAFGTAQYYGSMAGKPLHAPIVGVAAMPTGNGYWEVAADGGVFAFGTAPFQGSEGAKTLHAPMVGMVATTTGNGYWEVAADGGVFAFGSAAFHSSLSGQMLNGPIVALAPTLTGGGYWGVASDGGVFAVGAAQFLGSMGNRPLAEPIVGAARL